MLLCYISKATEKKNTFVLFEPLDGGFLTLIGCRSPFQILAL